MMLLDCFSLKRTINCKKRDNEIEDYIKILDENLQLSTQNLDVSQKFIFQQDNDSKHTRLIK